MTPATTHLLLVVSAFWMSSAALGQSAPGSASQLLSGLDPLSLRRAAIRFELRNQLGKFDSVSPAEVPLSQLRVVSEGIKPWVPPAVGTTKYYDRVAQDLRKRNLDLGNTLDFGAVARQAFDLLAPKKKPRKKRAAELPLPTEEEVTVLNILWTSGPSTSVELYASLDSAALAKTTAENFWGSLRRMAKRGFVHEKLVSPQQLMLIGIGPFAIPIEMSAKNRRNRIYRYEPLVDRETLLTLLQSKQWLASQAGETGEAKRISRLLVKVLRNELP